ncbi:hypothetical protein EC9_12040 [Rosistilla ulvae]|uniref:Uncharacterized protein n=1 Tax=Rosistilla ulvae TaxID=1930277 RepID=A0A517LWN5_9BACT|nr:hypothetical protein [Rosistilla ulvae]QDS87028.1 hypothetical protein EC9_12040 [Rosistilla ulvae]
MSRFLLTVALLAATVTPALAQYPYPPYPYGGVNYSGAGSTIAGSEMAGMADLVRSSGYANLQNSEAAINVEQARSMQLDNRVKYAETYYEKRRIREEAKNYDRKQVTPEQVHRLADMKRPKPLSESQYNPKTGEIHWPLAAMQPIMNGTRRRIEQLMQERSPDGRLEPTAYFEIARLCEVLDKQVGAELDTLPMQEVSQAKAFIKSLSYLARQAAS